MAAAAVRIDASIAVRGGLLGLGRTRRVARSEIAEIKLAVGMQSGNRVYHDIQLHRTDGKTLKLASSIREKREADWLVDKMCDCLSGRD